MAGCGLGESERPQDRDDPILIRSHQPGSINWRKNWELRDKARLREAIKTRDLTKDLIGKKWNQDAGIPNQGFCSANAKTPLTINLIFKLIEHESVGGGGIRWSHS